MSPVSSQYGSTPKVSGLVLPCFYVHCVIHSDQVCGDDQREFNSSLNLSLAA